MANLRIEILDFRGFDTSIILMLRGGIIMSIGMIPDTAGKNMVPILIGTNGYAPTGL